MVMLLSSRHRVVFYADLLLANKKGFKPGIGSSFRPIHDCTTIPFFFQKRLLLCLLGVGFEG